MAGSFPTRTLALQQFGQIGGTWHDDPEDIFVPFNPDVVIHTIQQRFHIARGSIQSDGFSCGITCNFALLDISKRHSCSAE